MKLPPLGQVCLDGAGLSVPHSDELVNETEEKKGGERLFLTSIFPKASLPLFLFEFIFNLVLRVD